MHHRHVPVNNYLTTAQIVTITQHHNTDTNYVSWEDIPGKRLVVESHPTFKSFDGSLMTGIYYNADGTVFKKVQYEQSGNCCGTTITTLCLAFVLALKVLGVF